MNRNLFNELKGKSEKQLIKYEITSNPVKCIVDEKIKNSSVIKKNATSIVSLRLMDSGKTNVRIIRTDPMPKSVSELCTIVYEDNIQRYKESSKGLFIIEQEQPFLDSHVWTFEETFIEFLKFCSPRLLETMTSFELYCKYIKDCAKLCRNSFRNTKEREFYNKDFCKIWYKDENYRSDVCPDKITLLLCHGDRIDTLSKNQLTNRCIYSGLLEFGKGKTVVGYRKGIERLLNQWCLVRKLPKASNSRILDLDNCKYKNEK